MTRSSTSRAKPQGDKLRGELVEWRNWKDGWGFGAIMTGHDSGRLKITGTLIGAQIGAALELTGFHKPAREIKDEDGTVVRVFPPEFAFTAAEVIVPQDASGVVGWLSSTLPQISRRRAEQLVAHHGVEGTWRILDTRDAASLTRIDGITIARANEIFDAYEENKAERDRMVTLKSYGLTDNQIGRVIEAWGARTMERITENPYALMDFVQGFGWVRADAVALKMGLPKDSPARLRAGSMHILGEAQFEGHMYVTGGKLVKMTADAKVCGVDEAKVRELVEQTIAKGEFVRRGTGIFLPALDSCEQRLAELIAARILAMRASGWEPSAPPSSEADGWLDPSQTRAVHLSSGAPFCIITGGPGTGKSTCMRVTIDRLEAQGLRVALAAPTGKAAKRLSEATGRPARTIHRLLEWRGTFQRNAANPLDVDVVLIDEVSMLDTPLACDLLEACGPDTRVVFVGDAAQLPSVGPGRVLADLVESGDVPVARLTTVHRAALESWVCRNAPKVLAGDALELEEQKDFVFYECEEAADVTRKIAQLMLASDPPVRAEAFHDAQVLSPQRTGGCGVKAINAALQTSMNPAHESKIEWVFGKGEDAKVFRQFDRVLQTANNYTLEVFNGEVGIIRGFNGPDANASEMFVDFGDRTVAYSKGAALALDHAYALTIHKSQGSEFPWAIVVCHTAHTYMLTRNLLYTGITRAKKGVVIVGNRAGLRAAIEAKDPPKRNTKMIERIREVLAAPDPTCKPPLQVTAAAPAAPLAALPATTTRPEVAAAMADIAAATNKLWPGRAPANTQTTEDSTEASNEIEW